MKERCSKVWCDWAHNERKMPQNFSILKILSITLSCYLYGPFLSQWHNQRKDFILTIQGALHHARKTLFEGDNTCSTGRESMLVDGERNPHRSMRRPKIDPWIVRWQSVPTNLANPFSPKLRILIFYFYLFTFFLSFEAYQYQQIMRPQNIIRFHQTIHFPRLNPLSLLLGVMFPHTTLTLSINSEPLNPMMKITK